MNRRGPRGSLEENLRDIEAELRRQLEAHRRSQPWEPSVGDRVRIRIPGTGQVEGTVVGITARRIRVKPDGTDATVLRAPKNVTPITE